jgi:hypothetical protein
MKNRRLTVLLVILILVAGVVAALFWPTERRRALDRVANLDGTYVEQWDDDESRRVNIVALIQRPVTGPDLAALRHIRPLHRFCSIARR